MLKQTGIYFSVGNLNKHGIKLINAADDADLE